MPARPDVARPWLVARRVDVRDVPAGLRRHIRIAGAGLLLGVLRVAGGRAAGVAGVVALDVVAAIHGLRVTRGTRMETSRA
jgi:hypothetical protein